MDGKMSLAICDVCNYTKDLHGRCKCAIETKEKCPGRSQTPCPYCGKCLGLFEVCTSCEGMVGTVNTFSTPAVRKPQPLEKLYDELGKLSWADKSVEDVRKYIKSLVK